MNSTVKFTQKGRSLCLNQYCSILYAFNVILNQKPTQCYSILQGSDMILPNHCILHAYWVVFNSIIPNVTITPYYMNSTILLNITCILGTDTMGSIQHQITQYSIGFIFIYLYYSILQVILSDTEFKILLHIGQCFVQYYLMLPEQLVDGHTVDYPCTAIIYPGLLQFELKLPVTVNSMRLRFGLGF